MSGTGVRLTSFSHGAGCACKLAPAELRGILGGLAPEIVEDERLLVGYETADDAGVYLLRDDLALVFTADFFTPIVDDPFDWGRVAAANAMSDVYAMGGSPLMALNLVAWPREGLPFDLLTATLEGGREVARDAGAIVVGGHSIDDAEPKYGMAVVGTADPEKILSNSGGTAGDVLVLTKPIGLGVVSTAIKQERAEPAMIRSAVDLMTTLNDKAAGVAVEHGLRCATDVTGFGLLGHVREIASASRCAVEIDAASVPLIEGVRDLAADGMVAGGTRRNAAFVGETTDWGDLSEVDRLLLCDAQTSGGLVLCVPAGAVAAVVSGLEEAGAPCAAVVGRLVEGSPGSISC